MLNRKRSRDNLECNQALRERGVLCAPASCIATLRTARTLACLADRVSIPRLKSLPYRVEATRQSLAHVIMIQYSLLTAELQRYTKR